MLPYIDVLSHLDHIRYCSGQDLANTFGVTRATIHNCILRLEAMGINIHRVRGKGYKLVNPLDILNEQALLSKLSIPVSNKLAELKILHEVDSTNEFIAKYDLPAASHFSVVLAEMQTAGKGRRGRPWVSPYAANIYMSVLWNLQKSLNQVGALSPLLAISIVQALSAIGVTGLGLKWPNDIYCQNKKLAGLLIECSGEMSGSTKIVIGVGVNVRMSQQDNVHIDQQWTDIISNASNKATSRNEVAACLLNSLVPLLDKFDSTDIENLADDWAQWDILRDAPVVLHTPRENITGIARGIDRNGCLLLETDNGVQHVSAGDVSLRAQS